MSTLSEQVIGVYDVGDEVELRAAFVDELGVPADPSGGVVISYTKPNGTTVVAGGVSNPAVGTYVATVVPATGENGDWYWRAASAGDIQQAEERSFSVRAPAGLNANALVTMRAARAWCLREETDGSRDDLLALAINGVSTQIIRYCGREFFAADDEVRTFAYAGLGYMSLEPYELRALTGIRARYATASDWTTLNDGGTDIALRPLPATREGTFLYAILPEYAYGALVYPATLQRGLGIEVEITGDWGMEEIPSDVEMATLMAVDWRYKNPSGSANVNVGDLGQDSYYSAPVSGSGVPGLPGEVITMLEQFRRTQYGV